MLSNDLASKIKDHIVLIPANNPDYISPIDATLAQVLSPAMCDLIANEAAAVAMDYFRQYGGNVPPPPTTMDLSYDYEISNAAPGAGAANQATNGKTLAVSFFDQNSVDNSRFFATLTNNDTIACNGITWVITSVSVGTNSYSFGIDPAASAPATGISTLTFSKAQQ